MRGVASTVDQLLDALGSGLGSDPGSPRVLLTLATPGRGYLGQLYAIAGWTSLP
jgi:hypothetical protein